MKNSNIEVKELAKEFELSIVGETKHPIKSPGSVKNQNQNSISWIKNSQNLKNIKSGYAIVNHEVFKGEQLPNVTYLVTKKKAKLVFSQVLNKYFFEKEDVLTNCLHEHKKNNNIKIADNVFIGKNVEIGDGTTIYPNAVLLSNTKIGKNCTIGTHASIGTEGLGLEFDDVSGEYVRFPQLGNVIIEDNVEVGPNSTIRRAALDSTIIGKGTKMGSLVNVGHNCIVGKNCILTCQIVLGGSSVVGDNVYMGINSIVKNGCSVGSNVTLGQGAVVTKNVPDNSTYIGSPAESIEDYKLWSKVKAKLTQMFGKE